MYFVGDRVPSALIPSEIPGQAETPLRQNAQIAVCPPKHGSLHGSMPQPRPYILTA